MNPIRVGYANSFVSNGGLQFNYKSNLLLKTSNAIKLTVNILTNTFYKKNKLYFEIESNK
jgi:hypothetical protein